MLFLNGSYGVGKSSVLDHVGDRLAAEGRPFSLFDVDWFHRSWPPGEDDPANVVTEAANLAAVWANYRRVGPRQPVIAGVIASPADKARYAEVFDLPIHSVRLTARPAVAEERLRRRYTADQQLALTWHLDRHAELAARLDRAGGAEADQDASVLDTSDLTPAAVAAEVLRRCGLSTPMANRSGG